MPSPFLCGLVNGELAALGLGFWLRQLGIS